jgi:acyl-CoA synthetase (AMP-forming)/AMP-acid ligase II
VAPSEVELALADHPALSDVGVVGLPHPEWGEIVCAAIVVRAGATAPDLDELRAHVSERLARFKQPRQVAVVEFIPRTPATMQVQRRLLIEAISTRG